MTVYELPSLIALAFKLGLLAYAAKSKTRNALTKAFMVLLVVLSLFNLVEFAGLSYIKSIGFEVEAAKAFGFTYFALFIPAIALLLHISLLLSTDSLAGDRNGSWLALLYIPAIPLELLLLFTDQLVAGFEHFQYTVLRVPGPLYYLFEAYVVLYLGAAGVYLVYGARRSRSSLARVRNRLWLLALTPMMFLVVYLIVANHFGFTRLTSTFYVPIAMTFFLVVTAYATHEFRLFDIEFHIPWSRVRRRKTAFYGRIRAMISEIADLDSVESAMTRLADTLHCPVALIGGHRPVVAPTGATDFRVDVPDPLLRGIDHIVVRNEIVESMPHVHSMMKQHGIGAIVPFHPRSQYAAGWLLLGDCFSERVYTRMDFKVVEELFARMADLFLDKLVTMRAQLADAFREIRALEQRQVAMHSELMALRNDNAGLIKVNGWLRQQQPADALTASSAVDAAASGITLTLLGRDKALLKTLRGKFPQVVQYASASSSGFRRQPRPDVLIAHLGDDGQAEANALARVLAAPSNNKMAVLLYGAGAAAFVEEHKRGLLGRLVEVLAVDATEATWLRRIEALSEMAKALYAGADLDQPLLGHSEAFRDQMKQTEHLAGLIDPLLIRTVDLEAAVSLAWHIHETSGNSGAFCVLREADVPAARDAAAIDASIRALVASVRGGTLMIGDVASLDADYVARLLQTIHQVGDVRVIAACSEAESRGEDQVLAPFHPFVLRMPSMRERKQDMSLLVHYFTLQFNLQTAGQRYITQAELDELMTSRYPDTLRALKHAVFDLLSQTKVATSAATAPMELRDTVAEKNLEQYVAEFEARIIDETLKRCGGNKSKAARLLGLRPNTLHYKLERYGLSQTDKQG